MLSPCIQSSSIFLWGSKRRVRGEYSELFARGHSTSLRQNKELNADSLTLIYCLSFILGMNGSQRLKENDNIISYSYSQSRLTQAQAFPWHPFKVVDERQMCSTAWHSSLHHCPLLFCYSCSCAVSSVSAWCRESLSIETGWKTAGLWPVRTGGLPEGSTDLLPSHTAALASFSSLGPAPSCHCVCKQELLFRVLLLEPRSSYCLRMGAKCISIPPLHWSVWTCLSVAVLGTIQRALGCSGGGFLPGKCLHMVVVFLLSRVCSKSVEVQLVLLSIAVSLSGSKVHGLKIPHPLSASLGHLRHFFLTAWTQFLSFFRWQSDRSLEKLCSRQVLYMIQYDFKSEFVH